MILSLVVRHSYIHLYVMRYFTKRINSDTEYKEIDPITFNAISTGSPEYDSNLYKAGKIKWSLKKFTKFL